MAYDVNFDWIPFYTALAEKLRGYEDKRSELVKLINKIFSAAHEKDKNIKIPQLDKDIDPFTIYSFFNSGYTNKRRLIIIREFIKSFDISEMEFYSDIDINNEKESDIFQGIPPITISLKFYNINVNENQLEEEINNLWGLFISALNYAEHPTPENRKSFSDYFRPAINITGNGNGKITSGLFYIAPDTFLNLDTTNINYIYKMWDLPDDQRKKLLDVKKFREGNKITASEYFFMMEAVDDLISQYSDGKFIDYKSLSYMAWKSKEAVEKAEEVGIIDITEGSESEFLTKEWFKKEAENYSDIDEKAEVFYKKFNDQFAPSKLKAISDDDLLEYIFLLVSGNSKYGEDFKSLCYTLIYDSEYERFGNIPSDFAYKYAWYEKENKKKGSSEWKTSYKTKASSSESVSCLEAQKYGREIVNNLVKGASIIKGRESNLVSEGDYRELYISLNASIPDYVNDAFFLKYYHMCYCDLLPCCYSERWLEHILKMLSVHNNTVIYNEEEELFIKLGRINRFVRDCGISNIVFNEIILNSIGSPDDKFFRISFDNNIDRLNCWKRENYVSIGYGYYLGNLDKIFKYSINDDACKILINNSIRSDTGKETKRYDQIKDFYSVKEGTYVVAVNGSDIYAIGQIIGKYYFTPEITQNGNWHPHRRPVRWLRIFNDNFKRDLGNRNTFTEIDGDDDECFLYQLLHETIDEQVSDQIISNHEGSNYINDNTFITGFDGNNFMHNRIFFGAPGTGKSYLLNEDRKKLLGENNETDYERVTFHPDYSYANFVGTYKPVNDENGEIKYEYVPGPFMRTFVKAMKNAIEVQDEVKDPKPYLLIIEEINRADVAAVFGDVFQLLDRKDNVSEYPIETSEDMRKYLVKELGGQPKDYEKIRIPDNMFIWATMNSADQGVFPMDTAFKRRWDFEYIGIDSNESEISDIDVTLKLTNGNTQTFEWNKLRHAINDFLANNNINEDKQLGPYFISTDVLKCEEDEKYNTKFSAVFKDKVIMYLFEDAAKQRRSNLFKSNRYSEICAAFDKDGIFGAFRKKDNEDNKIGVDVDDVLSKGKQKKLQKDQLQDNQTASPNGTDEGSDPTPSLNETEVTSELTQDEG